MVVICHDSDRLAWSDPEFMLSSFDGIWVHRLRYSLRYGLEGRRSVALREVLGKVRSRSVPEGAGGGPERKKATHR